MECSTYSDRTTKITDQFWDNICLQCNHEYWSVSLDCICPKCRCKEAYVTNNLHVNADLLIKFKKYRPKAGGKK